MHDVKSTGWQPILAMLFDWLENGRSLRQYKVTMTKPADLSWLEIRIVPNFGLEWMEHSAAKSVAAVSVHIGVPTMATCVSGPACRNSYLL